MDDKERENRIDALHEASRHRLAAEKADDVVSNAKKYFNFLQGNNSESE